MLLIIKTAKKLVELILLFVVIVIVLFLKFYSIISDPFEKNEVFVSALFFSFSRINEMKFKTKRYGNHFFSYLLKDSITTKDFFATKKTNRGEILVRALTIPKQELDIGIFF